LKVKFGFVVSCSVGQVDVYGILRDSLMVYRILENIEWIREVVAHYIV
jgi:hypothetical protein